MRINKRKTYLKYIKNSVNTAIFKDFIVISNKKSVNITKNGQYSCALFVSSILYLLDLISRPHTTIKSTIMDLSKSGWKKVLKPKQGDVLVWEEKNKNEHLGFYWNKQTAISNSKSKSMVVGHHPTYKGSRKIVAIYRYNGF